MLSRRGRQRDCETEESICEFGALSLSLGLRFLFFFLDPPPPPAKHLVPGLSKRDLSTRGVELHGTD